MRAIDSEALITQILNEMRRYNYDEKKILTLSSVMDMVDNLPTVDAVEKGERHGESDGERVWFCPFCGKYLPKLW